MMLSKSKKKAIALVVAMAAVIAALAISTVDTDETLETAQRYALAYLANPDGQTVPISGDRTWLAHFMRPRLETEYALYAKRRYEFKVTCSDQKIGFLHVSMRRNPPAFIAVSRQSDFVTRVK